MIKYTNQLKEQEYNIRVVENHRKRGEERKKAFCDDIFTFDIETSSCWIDENNQVTQYKKGFSDDYWNELEPLSLCYIWQFSYNNTVYYGRELVDFLKVLEDLPKVNIIVWIHNASFEMAFLENIITLDNIFAKSPHKPMKFSCKEYPHIEFRCSYFLTGMSLELWGEQLGVHKLVGALDYDKCIRTPLTELDPLEMDYAEMDCIVVYEGIKKELETYKNVFDIPLTKTSKVRNILKDKLYEEKGYNYYIKKLVPTLEDYTNLREVFSGGYTHCNRFWADRVINAQREGVVISHWDFTSSYP